MSDNRRFLGSLALSKLTHVIVEKKNKAGVMTKCILLPIEANDMVLGEPNTEGVSAVYMPCTVVLKPTPDDKKQDGFITKAIDSKTYKAFTDAEKEASKARTPILGSFRDFSNSNAAEADVAGNAGGSNVFNADDDDDLPF